VVKGRHEVCGDLCHFLFRYGVGRILFTSLKDVFQRAAVLGCTSITKHLAGVLVAVPLKTIVEIMGGVPNSTSIIPTMEQEEAQQS
jgi:hypothetical protein